MLKILEPFYKYLIEKRIKRNHTIHENINFDKVREIGILYDFTKQTGSESFHNFLFQLKSQNKSFNIINFTNKQGSAPLQYAAINLTEKDINWLGVFSIQEINLFIRKRFDILYCICETLPLPFELILCESKAKFRIGRYFPGKEGLFDFMIDTKQNTSISYLIEQIVHFSGVIKK